MPERLSTGFQNLQADSLGDDLDGGTLEIYTGDQPADPNDAPSGTLLVTITLPAPAFGAASGGSKAKAGTWADSAVDAGVPGWFRASNAGATRNIDGKVNPETHIDDADGITDSDATITVDDTSLFPTSGTLRIESEDVTYSGVTSTTFTGCTRGANGTTPATHADNTRIVSKDYEMTTDNNDIEVDQTVTVDSFSITQPAT